MPSLLLLTALLACQGGEPEQAAPAGPDPAQAQTTVRDANARLKQSDFDGAASLFEQALTTDPNNIDAAVGRAYVAVLRGDLKGADGLLAAVQQAAGARAGEVSLRRAIIAARSGDLEAVRQHGQASGLAAGQLMAAEAALADADQEAALELLRKVVADPTAVGEAASRYLEFLEDEDPSVAALAENYALWALGQRDVAVRSVAPLIRAISESDWKDQELLLWAGRAAAVGEPQAASDLLESIAFPPTGQNWRVRATRAMIQCAEQQARACLTGFQQLEGGAPPVGLLNARITAAMLLDKEHADIAAQLLDERVSNATARAALAMGEVDLARSLAPEGLLSDYLKTR
jgi:tetratricopeptide (TPR) repeat protein